MRTLEILLMPGFVLAAVLFIGPVPISVLAVRGPLLFVATLLLVISVYAVNSYFGFEADRHNSRLRSLDPRSRKSLLLGAAMALLLSLSFFYHLSPVLPYLAAATFILWTVYSLPGGTKGRPMLGTLTHFVSQLAQFQLGVLAFSWVTPRSLAISVFFALLFASGHLMHEVKDFRSDRAAGTRTNAVAFGLDRVIAFYRRTLVLLPIYWAGLFAVGIIYLNEFLPFFVAAVIHVLLTWTVSTQALEKSETFQRTYRALYLLAGLATWVAVHLI